MVIPTNSEVNAALTSPVRKVDIDVALYDGATFKVRLEPNTTLQEVSIERIGEESKFFGFGICQKINVKAMDINKELDITTNYRLVVRYTYAPNPNAYISQQIGPDFYVTRVIRDELTNAVSITAYDRLYWASNHTVSELGERTNFTLPAYADLCAGLIGIEDYEFRNVEPSDPCLIHTYAQANFSGTETIRDALDDIAEATQTIYWLNYQDKLVFSRPDKDGLADLTVNKSNYIDLDSSDNRRLSTIAHVTALGDNISATTGVTGTTQYIRDNAFWSLVDGTTLGGYLDEAIEAVGNMSINQFDCSWRGDIRLEPGDKIGLINKEDELVTSFLFNDTLTYDGTLSEQSAWSYNEDTTETATNSSSLGEVLKNTAATVDKVNQEITLVVEQTQQMSTQVTEVTTKTDQLEGQIGTVTDQIGSVSDKTDQLENQVGDLAETTEGFGTQIDNMQSQVDSATQTVTTVQTQMSQLQLNVDGISAEVYDNQTNIDDMGLVISEINQKVDAGISATDVEIMIQESLYDGVQEVTTETGYTFDKDGLTISKSDSDLSTQITENGLTINRNDDTVLTANDVGVEAKNLHATTYLIIGLNSRFEDYDNKQRTGCFWIGE